jgi:diguanylate cyclase (GGDEF)-like protein
MWIMMRVIVMFFKISILALIVIFFDFETTPPMLIVPIIILVATVFVLLQAHLARQTAVKLSQIAILEIERSTDPLTKLYNRRYLDERLNDEFRNAKAAGSALSILIIDIDNFKRINDSFGHQTGDKVLIDFAALLAGAVERSSLLARYGGDEFIIIAIEKSGQDAEALGDHINAQLHGLDPDDTESSIALILASLTVSIGIYSIVPKTEDVAEAIFLADRALLAAKAEGRDRIVVSE